MVVERLKAENYDELMDFINMVFSQDLIIVHFQEDLPLCFGRDDEHMRRQYAVRDDSGRIRSAIGVIPYKFVIDGKEFNARTITNVATHYQHTGKGYMQSLLKKALEDMKEEGVDFVILTGHRERYRFWGFEAAGVATTANYAAYNIVNREKKGEQFDYTFELITENDKETIRRCLDLFNKEPQHYVRTEEDFLTFHGMWRGEAYAVKNADGEFCGYLNSCGRWGGNVRELLLYNQKEYGRVMLSFVKQFKLEEASLNITPFGDEMLRNVYDTAESISSTQTCRMNLLRPAGFIEACLNLKQKQGAYMPEGEIVIDSVFGKLLFKNDGQFTVTETDREADFTVPGYEMYSLVFGPASQPIAPFAKELGKFAAWFPVPFYIHATDRY